ncbi:Rrf2 family transcriptional regulator [Intestinimonas massiliensis (ex Afouda et al. 2020)]|uniref:Rrf2 family transcriptional regulator n=1 Tax=Intestinimonas massiliensis (ex Afouda et al. 2020) TaxID=1673721 RepID=UPI001031BA23|nr:Rrf2 family transcriptional regulator [Intestinimonas massiliensis (ex Afouda et al. 2020)]
MQLSMKCSVAVHCLIFIYEARGTAKVTSSLLAQSTGVNPVVIRNILSALKKAGLITVARGTGGAELCREPEQVTLYQIYSALEPDGLSSLIGIHPCGQRPCPVARNIRKVLAGPYQKIEESIRAAMEETTLASMLEEFHRCLDKKE